MQDQIVLHVCKYYFIQQLTVITNFILVISRDRYLNQW